MEIDIFTPRRNRKGLQTQHKLICLEIDLNRRLIEGHYNASGLINHLLRDYFNLNEVNSHNEAIKAQEMIFMAQSTQKAESNEIERSEQEITPSEQEIVTNCDPIQINEEVKSENDTQKI